MGARHIDDCFLRIVCLIPESALGGKHCPLLHPTPRPPVSILRSEVWRYLVTYSGKHLVYYAPRIQASLTNSRNCILNDAVSEFAVIGHI